MTDFASDAQDWMRWTGFALSGVVVLFMLMDATMKLLRLPVSIKTTAQLGWPEAAVPALGGILLISTALYVFPPTSVLGAILLTGYLGGAVATHARIGSPLFSHVLFGVYLGVLAWSGLYLLNDRLRALLPVPW